MTETDIPPGGEGNIEVTFNTGHREGDQKKVITVESNDPNSPKTRLDLTGVIQVEFGFATNRLLFGKVSKDSTVVQSAFIKILDPEKTKITDITTSSPYIEAKRLAESSDAGKKGEVEIEVTIRPGLPVGRLNETVIVQSNIDSKAKLALSGAITGDVEVTPDVLRFFYDDTAGAKEQLPQKKLQIVNRAMGTALRVLEVRDSENMLDLDLTTTEEGRRYELTATLKKETLAAKTEINGDVIITTNNSEQKEITVRYSLIRRK